ncbi:hypothetical protein K466DRAFT_578729 [Polyporus arcularius HHB13444]|uniref:SUN domain-containing protein n=1 Tax=Polyporus arcularius HHB13444 TaxID=1314778 RepID=A0A5C3NU88_9APHY|nr:hypothetical protein K466DRAFT_578729 [Polyporus arcularius HHB13444]
MRKPPHEASPNSQLEAYVRRLVSSAMRDPVGLQDFALHALGAKVLPQLTTMAPGRWRGSLPQNAPEEALRDSLHVGQCWLVKGTSAQLGIALHSPVYPTHVTVDHVPLEIAPDIGQAPRRMLLWGLVEGKNNLGLYHELSPERAPDVFPADLGRNGPPVSGLSRFVLLASFEYNIFAPFHIQTFPVNPAIVDTGFYFGIVVLEILDNWGGDTTCLHRVRVHGHKRSY